MRNTYNAYTSIPNRSRPVDEDYAVLFNVVSMSDLHSVTKFKESTLSVLSHWFLYCITQCGISDVMTRRDETPLGSRFALYLGRQKSDRKTSPTANNNYLCECRGKKCRLNYETQFNMVCLDICETLLQSARSPPLIGAERRNFTKFYRQ